MVLFKLLSLRKELQQLRTRCKKLCDSGKYPWKDELFCFELECERARKIILEECEDSIEDRIKCDSYYKELIDEIYLVDDELERITEKSLKSIGKFGFIKTPKEIFSKEFTSQLPLYILRLVVFSTLNVLALSFIVYLFGAGFLLPAWITSIVGFITGLTIAFENSMWDTLLNESKQLKKYNEFTCDRVKKWYTYKKVSVN